MFPVKHFLNNSEQLWFDGWPPFLPFELSRAAGICHPGLKTKCLISLPSSVPLTARH